jgi:hypothetical protein
MDNQINNIIKDNNLSVSYSINYDGNTINKNSNKIYPIHSISKLFTNIVLVLLYNDNIVNAVNDTKEVCSSSAYVLFYVRKDIKGAPYTYTLPKFKPPSVKYNIGEERDEIPQLPTDIEDDNNTNESNDRMRSGSDQRRVKHTSVLRQGPKKINPENDTSSTWRSNIGNKDQCHIA